MSFKGEKTGQASDCPGPPVHCSKAVVTGVNVQVLEVSPASEAPKATWITMLCVV